MLTDTVQQSDNQQNKCFLGRYRLEMFSCILIKSILSTVSQSPLTLSRRHVSVLTFFQNLAARIYTVGNIQIAGPLDRFLSQLSSVKKTEVFFLHYSQIYNILNIKKWCLAKKASHCSIALLTKLCKCFHQYLLNSKRYGKNDHQNR